MRKDLYKTLGISEDATSSDIKRAYRRLARRLHPDVNPAKDAAEKMVEVIEAYRTLSDRTSRAEYDARRRQGIPEAPAPPSPAAAGEVKVSHHVSALFDSPIYAISFSPNGEYVAVGLFDNTLHVVSTLSGKEVWRLELMGGALSALRWVGAESIVAAGASEKSVSFWKITRKKLVDAKNKRIEWVSQVAVSPNGERIAFGGVDRTLTVVDRKSGKTRYSITKHDSSITSIAFCSDGRLIGTGGNDHRIILLEAATAFEYSSLDDLGAAPTHICFSPDDSLLAASLTDRSVRVYEMRTASPTAAYWGHEAPIEALAFHPSGWLVASGCRKGQTHLWNGTSGRRVAVVGGHDGPVKGLAFSPDEGSLLAVGGLDRVLSLWRIQVGEVTRRRRGG